MPTITPQAVYDAHASENNIYSESDTTLWCGSNSVVVNAQVAILFDNVQVGRGEAVESAPFTVIGHADLNSSSLIVIIGAQKVANASQPTSGSDILGRTMTTARLSYTFTGATAKSYTFDLKSVVQEIVNQPSWQSGNDILIQIRPTGGSGASNGNGGRRLNFESLQSSTPPTLSITSSLPTINANVALNEARTYGFVMTGSVEEAEPAEPNVATLMFSETRIYSLEAYGGRGDLSKNYPFTFLSDLPDTHHFVTEGGEVYGFSAKVPELLGGIRNAMLGAQDDAWYPASGITSREPAPLEFDAALLDRDQPRLERDRLASALKDARALHLPDGRAYRLWNAQQVGDAPNLFTVPVSAAPYGAEPEHVLLRGSSGAAFETEGSSKQIPIYAVDPAGGFVAPILPKRVTQGALCFGVRCAERGIEGLASVGPAVDASGSSDPASITVSYQRRALEVSLFGYNSRFQEAFIGVYGAVLACYLFWRPGYAHLVTVSSLGVRHFDLPVGEVADLNDRIITAGIRSDGVGFGGFIAPGSPSLDAPFFSLAVPSAEGAEAAARNLYTRLTHPGLSWAVKQPDISLELSRADDKALEFAPGESVTFDLAVRRVGGYTGALEFVVTVDTLTSSYTVTQTGDTDTYHVTLSAPVGTPEAAYTLRAEVKAAGADNEGSILKNVRDSFDAVVQVAAGPAIAPNATALYFANDPVQRRDNQMLMDGSGNGNTLFWEGYARPNREFTALLATGVYGAHVRSGALANAAQAQRMNGNQTHSLILGEIDKSKDGTVYHARAGGGDNGVLVLKSGNGFKLQTVNGGSTVTSPDTLTWRGGRARLILVIDTGGITLLDRDAGSSISLARPAWPDDGVKAHLGATRANSGAVSNLTRVYCYAWSIHPYALSDIARRRNMDALQAYAPKSDGKGEFPDNAFGILLFDAAGNLLRNYGAPALNLTLQADGSYSTVTGRGVKVVSGSGLFMNTGVSSSETVSYMTTVLDFNQTSDYNAVTALDDSTNTVVSASVTKHASGSKLFPMQRKSNGQYDFGTFGPNQGAGKLTFLSRVSEKGRKHFCKEFTKGESRTIDGDVDWPGQFVFSIGGAKRPDGSYFQRTTTTNLSTVLVRGEFTSDDQITTRALLEG